MDTRPYPRRTIDSITAALAGGFGVIATLVIGALVGNSGQFYSLTAGSFNATSTAMVASMTASSTAVGTSGTRKTGEWATTVTVDPQSIGPGQTTTTAFTLTGIAAGDYCTAVGIAGDLSMVTSTARLSVQAATNGGNIGYYNSTSTAAYDAASSVIGVRCQRFQ